MLPQGSPPLRLQVLGVGFLALVMAGAFSTGPVAPERVALTASATGGQHAFRQFTTDAAFRGGTPEGVRIANGSVSISKPAGTMSYAGKRWAWSRWTSGWVQPGGSFSQLLPTWNAVTPANTFVQVQARVRSTSGRTSG